MLKAGPVRVLGAMSGTSLDGVDAAEIVTDGHEVLEFGARDYRPYSTEERAVLRAALGRWPDEAGVAEAAEVVETAHAELLGRFETPDLVGFHGQTLTHDPGGRGTHQVGDGRVLAEFLGAPVVWDFRTSDVELGGQGAPLAPFYHFALACRVGAVEPLGILNLGGVGNLTWIDPALPRPESEGALLAFDTGPANAPIDDLIRVRTGAARDENGALARRGTVAAEIVSAFLERPYFYRMAPKSLDRDTFADLGAAVAGLPDADAAATLTACAASAVVSGIRLCPSPPKRLLVSGGGRRNAVLMEMLGAGLDCPVLAVEAAGFDGDMIEAQAFAYLATRVARGLPTSAPGTTGVRTPVGGGKISWPGG